MADIIGGDQSPKQLLDAVMAAAASEDIATLAEMRNEFLSVPANIAKCIDGNGNTIAHLAVHKDPTALKYVIEEYGADINAVNGHGKTPLHIAVKNNYSACTQYLLKAGAKDSVLSLVLSTPFHTAASCGSIDCLELLLANAKDPKARLNEVDRNKCTALHKCAHDGGLRVATWLVDKGAEVDAKDIHDTTPLLVAAKMGREAICEMLIKHGADVNQVDERLNSAVHYATSKCLPSIFNLLLDNGATFRDPNVDGNTPLHLVFQNQHPEIAGWEDMAHRMIRDLKPEQLDHKNLAQKSPFDYLSREQQPRFKIERVQELDRQKRQQSIVTEQKTRELSEARLKLLNEKRSQREEKERLQRADAARAALRRLTRHTAPRSQL
jgi:ankyrin repeat protein